MRPHLQYLWYVLRHKWFVFVAGLRLHVPFWQLLVHDLSKFGPAEWGPYVEYFYGNLPTEDHTTLVRRGYFGPNKADAKVAFDRAWNHHQKTNPHHWQYWLLINDQPSQEWVVTSMDGGMRYAGLANYARYPGRNFLEMSATGEQAQTDADELCALLNRAPIALEMPERYVREMVADWAGAGRAITGRWEAREWYAKHGKSHILHPATRAMVEQLLEAPE